MAVIVQEMVEATSPASCSRGIRCLQGRKILVSAAGVSRRHVSGKVDTDQ